MDPDTPPDVVFVILLDKHGKIRKREDFPIDLSFLDNCNENRVMIPIPLRKHEDLEICKEEKVIVKYIYHALDLGYAFTAWKVQGLIFDFIIIHLDGSKPWTFESLYVVFSRVTTNEGIRCLLLTPYFNTNSLKKNCLTCGLQDGVLTQKVI